jgi:protein gp37
MAEPSIELTDATWNPVGRDTQREGVCGAEREPGPVEGG